MVDLKQFNFKINPALLKQLKATAENKETTVTDLIIQGIHQILGLSPDLQPTSDLYKQLDLLEQRLQELEDYRAKVNIDLDKRISRLETNQLTASTVTDIATNIAQSIYKQQLDIVSLSQNNSIDEKQKEKPTNILVELYKDIAKEPSPFNVEIQLAIPDLEKDNSEENLVKNARKLNTSELTKTLRETDPNGGWDNDKVTNYRRYKKLKGKWHTAGNCKFKYADETNEDKVLGHAQHLWWVVCSDPFKIETTEQL